MDLPRRCLESYRLCGTARGVGGAIRISKTVNVGQGSRVTLALVALTLPASLPGCGGADPSLRAADSFGRSICVAGAPLRDDRRLGGLQTGLHTSAMTQTLGGENTKFMNPGCAGTPVSDHSCNRLFTRIIPLEQLRQVGVQTSTRRPSPLWLPMREANQQPLPAVLESKKI
jgi:hypothetical protein